MDAEFDGGLRGLLAGTHERNSASTELRRIGTGHEDEPSGSGHQLATETGTTSMGQVRTVTYPCSRPITVDVHTVLDVAGMVPVVGEVADGANAVLYALKGDWSNAAMSLAGMIPLWGNAATGTKLAKNTFRETIDDIGSAVGGWFNKILKKPDNPCGNSSTGQTLVLMADGSRTPIQDVEIGDVVLATDPETGQSGPRAVADLIRNAGPHMMVAVRLEDGTSIEATDGHPFWVQSRQDWVDAIDLEPGDVLLDDEGTDVRVTSLTISEQTLTAYNLTITGIHTYHASPADILVHNCPLPDKVPVNQMNQAIKRGQAPAGITRIDRQRAATREQTHAAFGPGQGAPSLNIDGTWKHGFVELTNKQRDWLIGYGWDL